LNRKSIIVWGGVVALLLVSAVLSAMWPSISSALPSGGNRNNSAKVSAELEPIHLAAPSALLERLPASFVEDNQLVMNPFLAVALLGGIVLGGIVVVGGGLTFAYTRLESTSSGVAASEEFQQHIKQLEDKEKQRLKEANAAKDLIVKANADYEQPRWSVISTGILALLFVTFIAMAISDTFYPGREIQMGGRMIGAPGIFIGISVLVTLVVMIVGFRPKTLALINGDETGTVPWDLLFVLISGFILLVLGAGLILWLR